MVCSFRPYQSSLGCTPAIYHSQGVGDARTPSNGEPKKCCSRFYRSSRLSPGTRSPSPYTETSVRVWVDTRVLKWRKLCVCCYQSDTTSHISQIVRERRGCSHAQVLEHKAKGHQAFLGRCCLKSRVSRYWTLRQIRHDLHTGTENTGTVSDTPS